MLQEQLGRLGGTVYELRKLEATIDGRPMVPLSVLGQLRRAIVEQLEASTAEPPKRAVAEEPVLPALPRTSGPEQAPAEPQLHVLCRSLAQLKVALECPIGGVIADFRDLREYAEAVAMAKAAGKAILLATPRIQKPGEMGLFAALSDSQSDGVLVRNLAGLALFRDQVASIVTDFSLNAANPWSADWLLGQGATRVTASYDLDRQRLGELAQSVPPGLLEVVVHQHMPMFHTEHCLFCALVSTGTDRTNCGRPCMQHEVRLRDRVGAEHLLRADVGCRNTLFNAMPQSAAEAVPALVKQGVRHFRIELLEDTEADALAVLVDVYQQLLAGRLSGKEAWARLKTLCPSGLTRGMLETT
jgi:putative protease